MKKGFTLVELMVVIILVGILAAVGVPKLFGLIAKSKASEVPVAAGSYVKLQEASIQSKSLLGTWKEIGYAAPSAGKTTNFCYNQGTLAESVETKNFSEATIGWGASNLVILNDCDAGSWWSVTISPENENTVSYAYNLSSANCKILTTQWNIGTTLAGDCESTNVNGGQVGVNNPGQTPSAGTNTPNPTEQAQLTKEELEKQTKTLLQLLKEADKANLNATKLAAEAQFALSAARSADDIVAVAEKMAETLQKAAEDAQAKANDAKDKADEQQIVADEAQAYYEDSKDDLADAVALAEEANKYYQKHFLSIKAAADAAQADGKVLSAAAAAELAKAKADMEQAAANAAKLKAELAQGAANLAQSASEAQNKFVEDSRAEAAKAQTNAEKMAAEAKAAAEAAEAARNIAIAAAKVADAQARENIKGNIEDNGFIGGIIQTADEALKSEHEVGGNQGANEKDDDEEEEEEEEEEED